VADRVGLGESVAIAGGGMVGGGIVAILGVVVALTVASSASNSCISSASRSGKNCESWRAAGRGEPPAWPPPAGPVSSR